MTSSYSKTSVFVRPHENDKPAFSKISTLGTVLENLGFWYPKTPFTCGRKAKTMTEKKKSPFSKISGCAWTRPQSLGRIVGELYRKPRAFLI